MQTTDPNERSGPAAAAPDGPVPLAEIEPVPVRVRFEQRETGSEWQPRAWQLAAVEPGEPGDDLAIRLFRDEAEGYYLNVTTEEPSIFVLWRLVDGVPSALQVTLSYNEAGRWMDGGETVDRVPMPPEMVPWLAEYVTLHYRPETGRKRRGAKPSFMRREEFAGMAAREGRDGGRGPAR
jgi:hypothetical protein